MRASLKLQLLLTVSGVTILLLCLSQYAVYSLIRFQLYSEFDHSLIEKVRVLALMIDQDNGLVDADFRNQMIPEFTRTQRPEYFQLWHENGQVLARSSRLKGRDLPRQFKPPEEIMCYGAELPDGRPGRAVTYHFQPVKDCPTLSPGNDEGIIPMTSESMSTPGDDMVFVELVVARDTLEIENSLAVIRWIICGACLITVALAVGILSWLVNRSLRPLQAISRQMDSVDVQNLQQRFELPGAPIELLPIVDRLNELVARLDEAFLRERTFSADIAHELRTPLAGIRSTLELALCRRRDNDSYRETIQKCLQISGEMELVVSTLLMLAQPASVSSEENYETIQINQFLHKCWRPYTQRAARNDISVHWMLSSVQIDVVLDRGRLAIVVANLMDNAVSYVNSGGEISIESSQSSGELQICVSNTGCQLSQSQIPHIFECFWRADPARTGTGGHAGLGLTLAMRIVKSMEGMIQANLDADRFRIMFSVPVTQIPEASAGSQHSHLPMNNDQSW